MNALRIEGWQRGESPESLLSREWLVTNALGGYATGTIAGVCTRRYHGLLIAAHPAPLGRYVMLNHLEEMLEARERQFRLSGDEPTEGALNLPDTTVLESFHLESGLPVWTFANNEFRIVKRLMMPHLQNTTLITYHLADADAPVTLALRPSVHFRQHEHDVVAAFSSPYSVVQISENRIEITAENVPSLRFAVRDAPTRFIKEPQFLPEMLYRLERDRGYAHRGLLWSPGIMILELAPGSAATVAISTEPWAATEGIHSAEAFALEQERRMTLLERAAIDGRDVFAAQLVLAADQFVIEPMTRTVDTARARAAGHESRTVIAGYHWFTDWGRDTMISLDGLALATGRHREAASILRTFASYVRDGLIPNMFPEGEHEGLYHTADATMWFFHAVHRYLIETDDRVLLGELLPILNEILDHHIRGTRFGIGVDPDDGLLRQGAEGYQLTWMDAKVDGWVVTPRRGKAVEINALFYNALSLTEEWTRVSGDIERADALRKYADRVERSFNERFWNDDGQYLFDVVDAEGGGNDRALRPNQIFAVALDRPVLDESRWMRVVDVVREELLTPVGLRSLSRDHPDYKPLYDGDLRSRDAAYHQGTVWGWLIGPFLDAWMKVHPEQRDRARSFLDGFRTHLREACVGSISEIFDAEAPFTPRGCIAQAWSVAEVLRWMKLLR